MQALRVIASLRVWLIIAGVAAVLALIYFAYLAAVASPEENLKDLPIALVNEDEGGKLGGQEVNLGGRVVENVTDPDSPVAETVEWTRLGGRDEAMEGIGNDEYYGAIVIPADYSERISSLASPPTIPIAVVNEDEGAVMNGQPMRLGEEVAKRITATPAPPFVQWARIDDRATALEGLEQGDFYAAIVLPKDYSLRLASMSGPPAGAPPSGAPTARAPTGVPATPEPAEIELVTSPAARPSVTALIEEAFSGIVGGVSDATSERILDGLSEQGAQVPPGAGALITDPLKGKVSEAKVSAGAGPFPEAPSRRR